MKLRKLIVPAIGILICTIGSVANAQNKTPVKNDSSYSTSKTTIETDNGVRTTIKTKTVKTNENMCGNKMVKETKTDKKVETDPK